MTHGKHRDQQDYSFRLQRSFLILEQHTNTMDNTISPKPHSTKVKQPKPYRLSPTAKNKNKRSRKQAQNKCCRAIKTKLRLLGRILTSKNNKMTEKTRKEKRKKPQKKNRTIGPKQWVVQPTLQIFLICQQTGVGYKLRPLLAKWKTINLSKTGSST